MLSFKFFFFLAKLQSRSQKVAFSLLNKVGSHRDGNIISQGDRVSYFTSPEQFGLELRKVLL